jgi:hypothetical protein
VGNDVGLLLLLLNISKLILLILVVGKKNVDTILGPNHLVELAILVDHEILKLEDTLALSPIEGKLRVKIGVILLEENGELTTSVIKVHTLHNDVDILGLILLNSSEGLHDDILISILNLLKIIQLNHLSILIPPINLTNLNLEINSLLIITL